MDVCRQVMPGNEWLGQDHWVRCHLYGPGPDPALIPARPDPYCVTEQAEARL